MKKILFSACLLTIMNLAFSSCSKGSGDEEEDEKECELTVASLAGVYKIISARRVDASGETDITHEIYEDCELDDTNELKADGTFVYSDRGAVCDPAGNFTGTWSVNGNTLRLESGLSNIESFNCTDLVVSYRDGSGNLIKEVNRKQ
ncbi:MAG: hypothetical protein EOO05_18810 [Chitinophagaceae bacterium]|nr:MAG: hypothetical protein EOO05_18810 [Chitinophagaceae bacterium]